MPSHRLLILCMLGVAEAALLGCSRKTVIREQPVVVKETPTTQAVPIIIQSETMPAPRVENPGPPPGSNDTWVAGHWEKTDRGWLWKEGHWERR